MQRAANGHLQPILSLSLSVLTETLRFQTAQWKAGRREVGKERKTEEERRKQRR
jgi:hypothetical protein